MKTIALILLVGAIGVYSFELDAVMQKRVNKDWELFKQVFNKSYENAEEEQARQQIWAENSRKIDEHNEQYLNGQHTYTVGMNHLGDMTHHEVKATLNGFNMERMPAADERYQSPADFVAPTKVDWRKKGAVTDIKDQGQCGSCWAFSTTGSLEGQHYLKNKKLVSLSEQNLVDCSSDEGNEGCNGGLMDQGFDYIIKNKGIDTEQSYPYTAEDGECRFKKSNVGATVKSYTDIEQYNEKDLTNAIATVGPVSVGIDASGFGFQFYNGGIYYDSSCSETELDHGVLAVGYGVSNKLNGRSRGDYYIVKNSWGKSWGMKGYLWMSRNRNNNCGIATAASYPKV